MQASPGAGPSGSVEKKLKHTYNVSLYRHVELGGARLLRVASGVPITGSRAILQVCILCCAGHMCLGKGLL